MNELIERLARETGLAFDDVANGLGTESTAEYRLEAFAKAVARECADMVAKKPHIFASNAACNSLDKAIRERFGL